MNIPSYERILDDALSHVPDDLDKRPGSIIYDALAPASFALYEQYLRLKRVEEETFAASCGRENLIKRAEEAGMEPPYAARASVVEATVTPEDVEIPAGTRFNCEKLNFFVQQKAEDGHYWLECETPGEAGNISSGTLLPIDYVEGLASAVISRILVYGEAEQDTEEYRALYFENIKNEDKDGNVKQYELWCAAYPGIGHYKVIPCWNGQNTVKVSILDGNNDPADEALIEEYQNYLDPESKGLGNGKAPIGAMVTVSTATKKTIDLTGMVTLSAGYAAADGLDELIREYLRSLAYVRSSVSYMAVGALILSSPAVDSLSDLRMNGGVEDISLDVEEIASYGTGEWTTQ